MSNSQIASVIARRIYDSRAYPTVEVEVVLSDGTRGRGLVPSGASTGRSEALELRDGGERLDGKDVLAAIRNVREEIAPVLRGMDVLDQKAIDEAMIRLDGTPNKSRLGTNAILGCSLAACWAGANYTRLPLYEYLGEGTLLPVPMVQIIGGGAHAVDSIDVQDYLVIPLRDASFAESYEMVANVYYAARKEFARLGKPLSIADEGGFWPTGFRTNEEGLAILLAGIERAGYVPGEDMAIALDIASSEFYDEKTERYRLRLEDRELTREEMADLLADWVDRYPIVSIEDGMAEEDWEGHRILTERLGGRVQLLGDDLFTTNVERIRRGAERSCCNAVLIKMNQIGTITETLAAIAYTQSIGYLPVVSARSGETEDATITHLAVATNAGQLKVGSAARSERTAKWNEAIRIEEELGKKGVYPGGSIFDGFGEHVRKTVMTGETPC